jgi:SAM-dependent methyltransferase
MSAHVETWNSDLYQSSHSYVWQYGRDLLALLDAKPSERILDVGCGTGQLTAEVAERGAEVVGVDASPDMIAGARKNHPDLRFEVADATSLPFAESFDAVLSNAALHWVRDQSAAIASISKALKPGGRFVFEMGGRGNLHDALEAGCAALRSLGVAAPEGRIPWYFPTIGQYAALLESRGFELRFAALFDRPTALTDSENGLASWIKMFGNFALSGVPVERHVELIRQWEQFGRAKLYRDGEWTIDYRRLRMVAIKL